MNRGCRRSFHNAYKLNHEVGVLSLAERERERERAVYTKASIRTGSSLIRKFKELRNVSVIGVVI